MTLYARGYRRYEDGFRARHLRFGPIFVEGYRTAIRTKSFRRFMMLFGVLTIVYCMLYYLNPLELARRVFPGDLGRAGPTRSELLRENVASFLGALDWLTPLLVLFVGSGLVAEDLRTRALPLYLVRPMTPVDYWLGKILIPAGVLAVALLLPALVLVVFGILLEPSETVVSFAAQQGHLVLGIVAAWAAASAAYGSLVILFSTLTGRRTPALVFGAASIFLSPVAVHLAIGVKTHGGRNPEAATGGAFELVKSAILPFDVTAIFRTIVGSPLDPHDDRIFAPAWAAVSTLVALFLLTALVVIRRARTVEVVS